MQTCKPEGITTVVIHHYEPSLLTTQIKVYKLSNSPNAPRAPAVIIFITGPALRRCRTDCEVVAAETVQGRAAKVHEVQRKGVRQDRGVRLLLSAVPGALSIFARDHRAGAGAAVPVRELFQGLPGADLLPAVVRALLRHRGGRLHRRQRAAAVRDAEVQLRLRSHGGTPFHNTAATRHRLRVPLLQLRARGRQPARLLRYLPGKLESHQLRVRGALERRHLPALRHQLFHLPDRHLSSVSYPANSQQQRNEEVARLLHHTNEKLLGFRSGFSLGA